MTPFRLRKLARRLRRSFRVMAAMDAYPDFRAGYITALNDLEARGEPPYDPWVNRNKLASDAAARVYGIES